MKRFLKEPWVAMGVVCVLFWIYSGLFETTLGGLIGHEAWWRIELIDAGFELSSEADIAWVFGTWAEAHFAGWPEWDWFLFPVEFLFETSPSYYLQIRFPLWIPYVICFVVGGIRLWVFERRLSKALENDVAG